MTKKNTTKRALLTSTLAMLMCVAMLIGTTFAWFTDTASTAVNKIQAGTLDIVLQYATAWDASGNPTAWDDAQGKTLNFRTADGRTTNILWEPGCTYELPALRILNNGNLALKYKIAITGINGSAKLNEAIEWTIGGDTLVSEYFGVMIPGANEADNITDPIVIKGHMKEEAGNEYQGLSINSVSITVTASQYSHESDSYDQYYDVTSTPIDVFSAEELAQAAAKAKSGSTIYVRKAITAPATIEFEETKTLYLKGEDIATLTVNAPNGTLHVYNNVSNKVIIAAAAMDSVHFYGQVQAVELTKGHVVVEKTGKVEAIDVLTSAEKLNSDAVVDVKKDATVNTITAANADSTNKLQLSVATGANVSNIALPEESITVPYVAKIGSSFFTTVEAAAEAATSGDTIDILASSVNYFAIPEGVTVAGKGINSTTLKTAALPSGSYKTGWIIDKAGVTMKNAKITRHFSVSSDMYCGIVDIREGGTTLDNVSITCSNNASCVVIKSGFDAGETVTISNSKINANYRGIYIVDGTNGTVNIDNCDVSGIYTLNVNSASSRDLIINVSNSKFHGWTSYSPIKAANFTNVEFSMGASRQDFMRPYADTTWTNCSFDEEFRLGAGAAGLTYILDNCTFNGEAVTASNIANMLTTDSEEFEDLAACTIIVNGETVTLS